MEDAIILIETIFPYKQDQKDAKWSFNDSLTKPNSDKQYWLAVNPQKELVGVTGLYHDSKDKNIA